MPGKQCAAAAAPLLPLLLLACRLPLPAGPACPAAPMEASLSLSTGRAAAVAAAPPAAGGASVLVGTPRCRVTPLPLLWVCVCPLQRYRFLEQVYKYHSSVEDEASAARGMVAAACSCRVAAAALLRAQSVPQRAGVGCHWAAAVPCRLTGGARCARCRLQNLHF